MEMLENPMVLPETKEYYHRIPDDVWAEMEDRDYEDMVFEEMNQSG